MLINFENLQLKEMVDKQSSKKNPLTDSPGAYCIHHIASGMLYVGSTGNLWGRWKKHLYCLKEKNHENKCLQAAYDLDRRLQFAHLRTETRDEAYAIEQQWLDKWFNTTLLFNIAPNARKARLGVKHRVSSRQMMSLSKTGVELQRSHRNKISNALIGVKKSATHAANIREFHRLNPASDEYKFQMSKARLGELNPNAKAVVVNGVMFETGSAGAKALGIARSVFQRRLENPTWLNYQYLKDVPVKTE